MSDSTARISAYASMGYFYMAQNNIEEARECFERAVEVAPTVFDGYWGMTWLLETENKIEEALKWYYKCLEIRPQWEGIIRAQIGDLHRQLNHYKDAENELFKALEIDPENQSAVQGLYDLARMLYQQENDPESSIRIYKYLRRIKGEPHEAEYQNNLGTLYYYQREYDKAATCYRKAIEHYPESLIYHENLSDTYVELEKWEEAKAKYSDEKDHWFQPRLYQPRSQKPAQPWGVHY